MAVAAESMRNLRCAAADVHAERMADLYQFLRAPLRTFLAQKTHSVHDAEDLAQEVFLRLWRMGAQSEIRHLKAFAFKVAGNLLKDRSRRTYTRMMRNAVPAGDVALADVGVEPSNMLESWQTLATVAAAIAQMPPRTREAFLLYRLEVCSHAQIAARMGVSVSMVEKYVSQATAALRDAGVGNAGLTG
jgi:RNA polymerase sigma factor (sigma-70 family)